MWTMLVIPAVYYKELLSNCATLWPEYRALKNGLIVRDNRGEQIEILCDPERAKLILNFAVRTCAHAVPHIRQIPESDA